MKLIALYTPIVSEACTFCIVSSSFCSYFVLYLLPSADILYCIFLLLQLFCIVSAILYCIFFLLRLLCIVSSSFCSYFVLHLLLSASILYCIFFLQQLFCIVSSSFCSYFVMYFNPSAAILYCIFFILQLFFIYLLLSAAILSYVWAGFIFLAYSDVSYKPATLSFHTNDPAANRTW